MRNKAQTLKKIHNTVIFLTIILLGSLICAQEGTIKGFVIDETTGLPLLGANVIISGTQSGAATGLDGSFTIPCLSPGDKQITASVIGYSSKTITSQCRQGEQTEITFMLKPIILDSGHLVTVTGNQLEGTTLGSFKNSNLTTTEDIISRMEGVNLISRGSYAQEPIFRGLSGGQVNITIDGMKCFGACTDRMDPVTSYIEVEALNSLEIGKGALSLESGSTVGGTLNLIHNRPYFSPKPSMKIWSKIETQTVFQGKKGSFNWIWSRPRFGLLLNGTYRTAQNYHDGENNTIPFTQYEKANYNMGILYRISDRTQGYFDFIGDDAWNIGYAALPMDVGYAQMRMVGAAIESVQLSSWVPKLEMKLYHNVVNHRMDDSKRENLFMNMHMDMPGFTRTTGGYADIVIAPFSKNMFQIRTEFYRNSHYANMVMYPPDSTPMEVVTWPDVIRWNFGQFIEYQMAFSKNASLKASIRYDYFTSKVNDEVGKNELHIYYPNNSLKRFDHLLSGNLFFDYRINSNWQTMIALASGSRIPTVTETYGYFLYSAFDGYLYTGNPNINPEKSLQIEWRNRLETDWFDLGFTLYRYNLTDFIFGEIASSETEYPYASGMKFYRNIDESFIQGIEISFLSDLDWHWSIFGSLDYEIGRLVSIEDNIPLVSPLETQTAIKYKKYPFWIQLDGKWSAEQNNISILGGENKTPAYCVLALRGQYLIGKGVTLNSGIDNLTNEYYYDHLDWADVPRPGRNFYISITYER